MNNNCLEGYECPSCGSEGPFTITVTCCATVHDDGIEHTVNHEWGDDAPAECVACGFAGRVWNFRYHDAGEPPELEPQPDDCPDDEPHDGFLTDAMADADALASAGMGTDEDYGYFGDGE